MQALLAGERLQGACVAVVFSVSTLILGSLKLRSQLY
jgi:hypothetical protein